MARRWSTSSPEICGGFLSRVELPKDSRRTVAARVTSPRLRTDGSSRSAAQRISGSTRSRIAAPSRRLTSVSHRSAPNRSAPTIVLTWRSAHTCGVGRRTPWSPDSRWIAVHYVDRRAVRKTPFPYYLTEETSLNMLRRGYPGDSNEVRTIGFYQVASGTLKLVDLPDPTANKITNFEWSPSGQLLLDRESDTAVDRWLEDGRPERHRGGKSGMTIARAGCTLMRGPDGIPTASACFSSATPMITTGCTSLTTQATARLGL